MKIPIISRLTGSEAWPAEIWIVKAFKNKPEIEKTRGRRVDEKEDRNDLTSQETRFELKGGGTTAPVPYSEIYQTNEDPLVILLSPERGTYVPAEIELRGEKDQERIEELEKKKEKLEAKIEETEDSEDLEEQLEEVEDELEDLKDVNVSAALDIALENQEWLRWGKQMVTDMKLSWEEDKGWWDRHGEKVVLVLAVIAVVTGSIMNYLGMNNLGQAVNEITEASQSIIPVMAFSFKKKLER